jgi:hypothetical protein
MKEIITLQFGSYSNYIGAHFWNFQVRHGNLLSRPSRLPPFPPP